MSVSKKLLPPPFMGEVAERSEVAAPAGACGEQPPKAALGERRGGSHFSQKSGNFRIFAVQIFWLPPAFGHPPHKCGGQDRRFFDKLRLPLEGKPCSIETGKSYRQRLPPGEGIGAAAPLVILSEGRSPKSKDLRTECQLAERKVRRSFDSRCSLRMTEQVLRSISKSWIII